MSTRTFNLDGRQIFTVDEDTFEIAKLMMAEGRSIHDVRAALLASGMESWRAMQVIALARREATTGSGGRGEGT